MPELCSSARGILAAAEARSWCGTPVKWEASLKGKGCDCRGLLAGVARELGWPEGREFEAGVVGYSQRIDETALLAGLDRLFDRRPEGNEPGVGDVLAFRVRNKVQHLAIAAGAGRMIHAYLSDPAQVIDQRIGQYWGNRLAGAWCWRPLEAAQ